MLPPQPPQLSQSTGDRFKSTYNYSTSQFSVDNKNSGHKSNGAEFALTEPPLEYSTPSESEIPRKTISENTADVKRGILSSLLEKVSKKEIIWTLVITPLKQLWRNDPAVFWRNSNYLSTSVNFFNKHHKRSTLKEMKEYQVMHTVNKFLTNKKIIVV